MRQILQIICAAFLFCFPVYALITFDCPECAAGTLTAGALIWRLVSWAWWRVLIWIAAIVLLDELSIPKPDNTPPAKPATWRGDDYGGMGMEEPVQSMRYSAPRVSVQRPQLPTPGDGWVTVERQMVGEVVE